MWCWWWSSNALQTALINTSALCLTTLHIWYFLVISYSGCTRQISPSMAQFSFLSCFFQLLFSFRICFCPENLHLIWGFEKGRNRLELKNICEQCIFWIKIFLKCILIPGVSHPYSMFPLNSRHHGLHYYERQISVGLSQSFMMCFLNA